MEIIGNFATVILSLCLTCSLPETLIFCPHNSALVTIISLFLSYKHRQDRKRNGVKCGMEPHTGGLSAKNNYYPWIISAIIREHWLIQVGRCETYAVSPHGASPMADHRKRQNWLGSSTSEEQSSKQCNGCQRECWLL